MADLATLRSRLTEAEDARHQLALGQTVVEIARDGRRMTFSKASESALDGYMATLTEQIRRAEDAANGTTVSRRRSIGVIFGR